MQLIAVRELLLVFSMLCCPTKLNLESVFKLQFSLIYFQRGSASVNLFFTVVNPDVNSVCSFSRYYSLNLACCNLAYILISALVMQLLHVVVYICCF